MTRIAFIGLGNMGSGMCANLCRAGFESVPMTWCLKPSSVQCRRGLRRLGVRPRPPPVLMWSSPCCPPASTC